MTTMTTKMMISKPAQSETIQSIFSADVFSALMVLLINGQNAGLFCF